MQDLLVVLGAEVASGRAIAKKLRMEHYCCKLMFSGVKLQEVVDQSPAGIIVAGEEAEGVLTPDVGVLSLGIPVMALGSSARMLSASVGERREGEAISGAVVPVEYKESPLFDEVGASERWVEHAEPFSLPEPYRVIATTDQCPLAFANDEANIYLLQFQIERNDPDGMAMLLGFADTVCGCTPWWTVENIIRLAEKTIRSAVGDRNAICAMSGGLDSTVAAMLAKRALGDKVSCVFVDTGLMREGEAGEAERYFRDELSLDFSRIDVSGPVLEGLVGLTTMRAKWQVTEHEITTALRERAELTPGETVYVKGTNYVDVLGGERSTDADKMEQRVVEPLRELFKDEIRMVGEYLDLSPAIINRQPFPGMGLAARIHGEVTAERLQMLRSADSIFSHELTEAGLVKRLKRYFVMFDTIDGRDTIILRATQGMEPSMNAARLPYDLLERTVEGIQKQMPSVERVLYDITPGMAEWR